MIESPLIDELQAEARAEGEARRRAEGEARGRALAILRLLEIRFGSVPAELREALLGVRDERRLEALLEGAARCADLEAFRAAMAR